MKKMIDHNQIEFQKFTAREMIEQLEPMFGTSIRVMGGAPRDWDNDNPARDIDIFIQTDLIYHKEIKEKLNIISSTFTEKNYYYCDFNPNLNGVYEISYNGETIQLIFTGLNLNDLMKKFTTNLSMIWWKDNKFYKTTEYKYGIKNKIILKMNNESYNNNINYISKIKNKFPHYHYFSSVGQFEESIMNS